jgi:hypothetical protein
MAAAQKNPTSEKNPMNEKQATEEERLERRGSGPSDAAVTSAVENPLARYSNEELAGIADQFAKENGLEHLGDDLRKGALLARNLDGAS